MRINLHLASIKNAPSKELKSTKDKLLGKADKKVSAKTDQMVRKILSSSNAAPIGNTKHSFQPIGTSRRFTEPKVSTGNISKSATPNKKELLLNHPNYCSDPGQAAQKLQTMKDGEFIIRPNSQDPALYTMELKLDQRTFLKFKIEVTDSGYKTENSQFETLENIANLKFKEFQAKLQQNIQNIARSRNIQPRPTAAQHYKSILENHPNFGKNIDEVKSGNRLAIERYPNDPNKYQLTIKLPNKLPNNKKLYYQLEVTGNGYKNITQGSSSEGAVFKSVDDLYKLKMNNETIKDNPQFTENNKEIERKLQGAKQFAFIITKDQNPKANDYKMIIKTSDRGRQEIKIRATPEGFTHLGINPQNFKTLKGLTDFLIKETKRNILDKEAPSEEGVIYADLSEFRTYSEDINT